MSQKGILSIIYKKLLEKVYFRKIGKSYVKNSSQKENIKWFLNIWENIQPHWLYIHVYVQVKKTMRYNSTSFRLVTCESSSMCSWKGCGEHLPTISGGLSESNYIWRTIEQFQMTSEYTLWPSNSFPGHLSYPHTCTCKNGVCAKLFASTTLIIANKWPECPSIGGWLTYRHLYPGLLGAVGWTENFSTDVERFLRYHNMEKARGAEKGKRRTHVYFLHECKDLGRVPVKVWDSTLRTSWQVSLLQSHGFCRNTWVPRPETKGTIPHSTGGSMGTFILLWCLTTGLLKLKARYSN